MAVYNLAWAVIVLPLLGGMFSFLAESQRRAAQVCVAACGLGFAASAVLLIARLTHAPDPPFNNVITLFAMNPSESAIFPSRLVPLLGIRVEAVSVSFGFVIAFVSLVVMWYALTSLRGEQNYRRFFWSASLLIFATAGFAFSPNLFDSLFAWAIGSVAIYVLLTHWWQRPDGAAPARRTLVVMRIGDVALLLALAFTYLKFGEFASLLRVPAGQDISDPFAFNTLADGATAVLHGVVLGAGIRTLVIIGILVFFAAMVRAAQVPFHAWLTEATTAPLPALALCATLGTIPGVIVLVQMYPLIIQTPHLPTAIALVGAATAAAAAITCLAQRDLLRIGVFAAVAQLGLAIAALGAGGSGQGMYIAFSSLVLITLLMLAIGNVMRVYRTRNLHEIGGAWRRMRLTSIALVLWALGSGGLSLTTYYALAATLSDKLPFGGQISGWVTAVTAILLVIASVCIALFAFRVVLGICGGDVVRRRGFQPERVVEVEPALRRPVVLVGLAVIASVLVALPGIQSIHSGKLNVPGLSFLHFVAIGEEPIPVNALALLLGLASLAGGAAIAYAVWAPQRRERSAAITQRFEPALRAVTRGLFIERAAHRAGHPVTAIAQRMERFDVTVVDALTDASAGGIDLAATRVSRLRTARVNLYLAGALTVVAVLALLATLAATGHFWIHTV